MAPPGSYRSSDAGLTITASVSPLRTDYARLRLSGDIDFAATRALSDTVGWLTAAAPVKVLIDLASVTFADSALLNFLAQLSRAVPRGTELILWQPPPGAEMILGVPGLAAEHTVRHGSADPFGEVR